MAGGNQLGAQFFVHAQAEHGGGDCIDVGRVDEEGGIACDFGQRRVVGCQDGHSCLLRLEHGKAEAFKLRRIAEEKRAMQQCRGINWAQVTGAVQRAAQAEALNGGEKRLAFPAGRAGEDEVESVMAGGAQGGECLGDSQQVFAGLQRADEERVGTADAVAHARVCAVGGCDDGRRRRGFVDDAHLRGRGMIGATQVAGRGFTDGDETGCAADGIAGAGVEVEALALCVGCGQVEVAEIVHGDDAGGQAARRDQGQHVCGDEEHFRAVALDGGGESTMGPGARLRQHALDCWCATGEHGVRWCDGSGQVEKPLMHVRGRQLQQAADDLLRIALGARGVGTDGTRGVNGNAHAKYQIGRTSTQRTADPTQRRKDAKARKERQRQELFLLLPASVFLCVPLRLCAFASGLQFFASKFCFSCRV